jgi:hypothetical protein
VESDGDSDADDSDGDSGSGDGDGGAGAGGAGGATRAVASAPSVAASTAADDVFADLATAAAGVAKDSGIDTVDRLRAMQECCGVVPLSQVCPSSLLAPPAV